MKVMMLLRKVFQKMCSATILVLTVSLAVPGGAAYGMADSSLPRATSTTISAAPQQVGVPGYTREDPPQLPNGSGTGRRVVYGISIQWVWVVGSRNNVIRAMPVSGHPAMPLPGKYSVKSQSLQSYSTVSRNTRFSHMTRFALGPAKGNIGFHSIPTKNGKPLQTEEQLGTFRSSGCVRMNWKDAKFVYSFAKIGTKVVVLP